MSRRNSTIAALGAAALVGAIGAALVLSGRLDESPNSTRRARITAQATVSARSPLFGDEVTARLDLLFSTTFVPASSVRVETSFTPYRIEAASRSRSQEGAMTRLTYVFRLSCLTSACLPEGERSIMLPHALVSYALPGHGGPATTRVRWPPLTTASRLSPEERKRPQLRTPVARLPAPTYRIRPALLAVLALGGAFVLLLVAAALLVALVPGSLRLRLPARLRRRPRPLTPLERALARVLAASANGGDERRALEQLAVELGGSDELDLAGDARRLAWSPGRPPAGDVSELASQVELLIGRPA